MDINRMLSAVAGSLRTVPGLRVYDGYRDKPEPPCAFPVLDIPLSYQEAMSRGAARIEIVVHLVTAMGADETGAMRTMNDWLSSGVGRPSSVIDALTTDPTFGGTVDTSVVNMLRAYGATTTDEGFRWLTAEIAVTIFTRRNT